MKKYRIYLKNERTKKKMDVLAESSEAAFQIAYQMPDIRKYREVTVEEIPVGPTVIGIKFRYLDTVFKKEFCGYLFIRANNEEDAVKYYNKHFLGKRFWFDAGKTEDDGKCIRKEVLETYFARCPGYDADATKKEY